MLPFLPPGFRQTRLVTSLGAIAAYVPIALASDFATTPATTPATNQPTNSVADQPPGGKSGQRPAPLLLFLHSLGGGSSAYEWSQVYGALAGQYPVVAIDAIGWGESDHPARDYRVDDYLTMLTEAIAALRSDPNLFAPAPRRDSARDSARDPVRDPARDPVRDFSRDPVRDFSRDPARYPETPEAMNGNGQVAAERPLIVVASSLMGAIAVRWAIAHSEQVQGLILACPSGLADFGVDYGRGPAAALARVPGVDRLLYGVGAANEVAVRSFLEQVLLGQRDRLTPQTVAAYLASALKPNADYAALASLRGDLCFDLAGYMAALTTPTVLLWGTAARFSSVAVGRRLAQLNPAAVCGFYEVPTAGVLPQLELPSMVTRILLQVLSTNVLGIMF